MLLEVVSFCKLYLALTRKKQLQYYCSGTREYSPPTFFLLFFFSLVIDHETNPLPASSEQDQIKPLKAI